MGECGPGAICAEPDAEGEGDDAAEGHVVVSAVPVIAPLKLQDAEIRPDSHGTRFRAGLAAQRLRHAGVPSWLRSGVEQPNVRAAPARVLRSSAGAGRWWEDSGVTA